MFDILLFICDFLLLNIDIVFATGQNGRGFYPGAWGVAITPFGRRKLQKSTFHPVPIGGAEWRIVPGAHYFWDPSGSIINSI